MITGNTFSLSSLFLIFFKGRIVNQKPINNYLSKINGIQKSEKIIPPIMKYRTLVIIILGVFIVAPSPGQNPAVERGMQSITTDALKGQLGFLSSDWMEGREAGEKGEYLAADYIASMLRLYGIKPAGDNFDEKDPALKNAEKDRSYFQNFILIKTSPGDEQVLKIKSSTDNLIKTTNLTYNLDFIFRPSDQPAEIEAPVVFAGYGYISDSLNYNDFKNLDVRGKYILKIAGFPKFINENLDNTKAASYQNAMESKYKAMGIIGVLEYEPDATVVGRPERKAFMDMSPAEEFELQGRPHSRYSIPGKKSPDNLIKIQISVRTANEILNGSGIHPEDYIGKADKNEKYEIPGLKGKSIYFKSSVKCTQIAVRNILGIIEGKNPDKYIVLGAHYDHIGAGNGYIWNGADDNGSGTVGVLTIARAIKATGEKPENSIIFAFWTAEEEGLLGSRYYVRNLPFPSSRIKLNMNFDMISRYISEDETKKVTMTYTSSFPQFRDLTSANLEKHHIDLDVDYQPSSNPPGGTDHRSFVEAGIPVIRFKPGHREEYHTPMDEIRTVDWDIMEKIIRISFADAWELANKKW